MTVFSNPVNTRSFVPSLRPPVGGLGRAYSHARSFVSRLPLLTAGSEEETVLLIRRLHLQMGLEYWSDLELKAAIQKEKTASGDGRTKREHCERTAKVFAIVNESISRRLGVWRILKEESGMFSLPHTYNGMGDDYPFEQALSEEEIVGRELERVRAAGQGRFGPDLLLPASFYQAVRRLDDSGRYRFLPTDQQLLAGLHLLSSKIVEMQAGEGKTVAIAFAAVLHTVLGRQVHIHTANDYLAERDCRLLSPVYRSLGLTTGVVLDSMDSAERRAAYACDIVYGTVREFGFDNLRDNLVSREGEQVQPLLQVAIVDEADQTLIDEGDTPLIIAGPPSQSVHPWRRVDKAVKSMVAMQEALCRQYVSDLQRLSPNSEEYEKLLCLALQAAPFDGTFRRMAREHPRSYRRGLAALFPDGGDVADETLAADLFYLVDAGKRFVTPTERGLAYLTEQFGEFCPSPQVERQSFESDRALSRKTARQLQLANQVYQSLRANLLLERDRDYVVAADSVVILDQHTGRTKPDNLYRHGLQAALEAKEGVTVHPDCETLAQISVQGFVNLYRCISGITGTAQAAAEEFHRRYLLEVWSVPQSQETRRVELPSRMFDSEQEKIAGIIEEVRRCQRFGRPVLVGTQSIEVSRTISNALTEAEIEHRVLNAVTSDEEADIVRSAGQFGAVTVATNLAGRGTDIVLDPDLNDAILSLWMLWVIEEIRTGNGPLRAVCYSPSEAAVLADALEDHPHLNTASSWQTGRYCYSIWGAGQERRPSETRTTTEMWEFGLGLHVINAEFSRYPRVSTQLKGRSGRQGMFGSGRQLLSWEDRWLLPLAQGKPRFGRQSGRNGNRASLQEGPAIEDYISRRQDDAELEAAAARSVVADYAAVCDAHTSAYYQLRREVLSGSDIGSRSRAAVRACASRLVNSYFPNLDSGDYVARFRFLAEEVRSFYSIEVSAMVGEPLDCMAELLEQRLLARIEEFRLRLGESALQSLTQSLLLECGDRCWREHLADLQQAVVSSTVGGHYHKGAVADYILHSRNMWEDFQARLQAEFCSRLLTFPLELLAANAEASPEEEDKSRELLSLTALAGGTLSPSANEIQAV